MKIGLVLECTKDGADSKVLPHFIKMMNEQHELKIQLALPATLGNFPKLKESCGTAAKAHFESGCDRVIIVWDLDSRGAHGNPDRGLDNDVTYIKNQLRSAGIDLSKVDLIGIRRELESWLIADGRAIAAVISKMTGRPARGVRGANDPESQVDPKSWLSRTFREHKAREYRDFQHAETLAKGHPDFREIRACETFRRFVLKISGQTI